MSSGDTAPSGPRAAARRTAARQLPPSDRPPYRLLADLLRQQIRAGRLVPGGQVPPSRVLGEDYGIAIMTARAAVRVLRDEGLVRTVQGLGTFVTDPLPPLPDDTGTAPAIVDQAHMPTAEYTELAGRIDELMSRTTCCACSGNPAGTERRPPRPTASGAEKPRSVLDRL
ncbi:GntR family transcriptional regulator [Streptomyces griseorubiginosus]|uniref:GntR family transcriptional regulator n=1 Tax=Streptomyces griseorubiginosus TaxID=67304 RepID=UPI0036E6167B